MKRLTPRTEIPVPPARPDETHTTRIVDRTIDVGFGRHVNDCGRAMLIEDASELGGATDVGAFESVSWTAVDLGNIRQVCRIGERVQVDDNGVALADQQPDQRRSDEPGTSGHQDDVPAHVNPDSCQRERSRGALRAGGTCGRAPSGRPGPR